MNNKEARHSSGFCYYCNNFIFRRVNPSFFFFGKHRTLLVRICVKSARRLAGADLQSAPFNRGFIIQFIKIKEAAHVGSFFKTFAKLGIRSSSCSSGYALKVCGGLLVLICNQHLLTRDL
jgi:hypothetical protein